MAEQLRDLGIDVDEAGRPQLLEGLVGDRHRG
jgi:hypothetical protein